MEKRQLSVPFSCRPQHNIIFPSLALSQYTKLIQYSNFFYCMLEVHENDASSISARVSRFCDLNGLSIRAHGDPKFVLVDSAVQAFGGVTVDWVARSAHASQALLTCFLRDSFFLVCFRFIIRVKTSRQLLDKRWLVGLQLSK